MIQYIGAFVLFKILATSLKINIFAEYLLFTAAVNLLLCFPFTGVQQSIMKFSTDDKNFFLHQTIAIAIAHLVIAASLLFFSLKAIEFTNIIPDLRKIEERYNISLAVLFAITEALKYLVLTYEIVLKKRQSNFLFIIVEYVLKIFSTWGLIYFELISFEILISSLAVCNLIVFTILMNVNNSNISNLWSTLPFRSHLSYQMLLFSLPIAGWSVFGWLRDMSGRYIVDLLMSKENVAAFSVLTTLTSIIPGFISALVGNYYIPIFYQTYNSGKSTMESTINKVTIWLVLLGLCSVIISIFLPEMFIAILISHEYKFIKAYLPYTISAYFIFIISMIASTELYIKGKGVVLFVPHLVSGLVSIFCFLFFVSRFGFSGSVLAYFLTYLSYAITVFYILIHQRSKLKDLLHKSDNEKIR